MKVVINACFGGFSLSHEGVMKYAELKGIKLYPWLDDSVRKIFEVDTVKQALKKEGMIPLIHYATVPVADEADYNKKKGDSEDIYWSDCDMKRDDPTLIQVIEELKEKAAGRCAELKIVEIPDDVEWQVEEYDGYEHIAEKHRTWD